MTITLKTLNGDTVELSAEELSSFKTAFKGAVLSPEDAGYDETRQIWNAMIDRRPGLIARCTGTVDVVQAVRFARKHGLLVSVRGGGHNIAGPGRLRWRPHDRHVADARRVGRPAARTARAQAGCTLGDVDRETQLHGLAAVLGFVSATGIAGLTLGGGFGYLTRRYGWTCDNVLSMEVVTADGRGGARQRAARTPTCSGRCAAAAATSVSSPRSSTGSTRSARRSSAARSRGAAERRARSCDCSASSPRGAARAHAASRSCARAARAVARPRRSTASRSSRCSSATRERRQDAERLLAPIKAFGNAGRRHRPAAAVRAHAEPARRDPAQGTPLLLEVRVPGRRSSR